MVYNNVFLEQILPIQAVTITYVISFALERALFS